MRKVVDYVEYDGDNLDEIRDFVGPDGNGKSLLLDDAEEYDPELVGASMVYNGERGDWQALYIGDTVERRGNNFAVVAGD